MDELQTVPAVRATRGPATVSPEPRAPLYSALPDARAHAQTGYHFRWLAWAVPAAFVIAAAVVYAVGPTGSAESALVLATGNALFLSATSFTVALLAARTFAVTGEQDAVAMGCGTLALGIVCLLAGPFVSFDVDLGVTVHNTGMLLAGAAFLVSAALASRTRRGEAAPAHRVRTIVIAYTAVVAVAAVLIWAAWTSVAPAFFVPGAGVSTLRQVVLGVAVVEFLSASAVLAALYRRTGSPFTRWYAPGLAMIGVGLATVWLGLPGSAITWVGRVAQWVGGAYLLVAILAAVQESGVWTIPLRQALRASQLRFKELVESLPQLVWTCDASGSRDYLSPQWVAYAGVPEADELGQGWIERLHPDDREPRARAWRDAVANGTPFDVELRLRDRDGLYRWFRSRAVPMHDEAGAVTQWLGTDTDVDDERRIEEALLESEDKFKYIFDHSVIGKSITFPSGEIHENEAFAAMLGYSREELEARRWQDLTHPDDIDPTQRQVDALLTGEQESARFEKRYLHRDGTAVWADVSTRVRRDADGRALYFITSVVDISERKRAEESIRRYAADLERSNKDLQQFAYVASHDLQEPLRMVASFVELLAERYEGRLDEKADQYIHFAVEGATRMQDLIQALLAYSRVESRGGEPEPTDANQVAASVLAGLRRLIDENGATVTVGDLPTVMIDPAHLTQLLQNLVENAVKFHGEAAPEVHISAGESGPLAEFAVSDNGIGIDPLYGERVFDIFQRLNTRAAFPGTGMGLAICKRVVERLGGRLWVEPAPGGGSIFRFTLPLAPRSEE